MPLLTFSQQQAIKKISANNEGKYNDIATEVEERELRDLLGAALLQDVQENPSSTENAKLLDGDTFEDCNGNTIKMKGIRWMLAYMNYVDYLGNSFVSDTFSGFVQKTRQDAEQLSEGTIKRLQKDNRRLAMSEWQLIENYLNENSDSFPLWVCSDSKKPYVPKIKGIKKTVK